MTVISEVVEQLQGMTIDLQQQVLKFAKSINPKQKHGTPASELLPFFGCIASDDIHIMQEAVDLDCGQIDYDGW